MANLHESELHFPLGERFPAPGEALEVAPGLLWVRFALPFALDHVNAWLVRDRDPDDGREGWAIVDCGIADDATRAAWTRLADTALASLPVLRVLVTHMHPDHVGLAGWLVERWQCRLWMSGTDWNAARIASQSTIGFGGASAAAFFASHGLVDPDALAKVRARSSYYPSLVPTVPAQYRRLMDGRALSLADSQWRCRVGYGHAPEHIALHDAERALLISGDMVLPSISTNVSVIDLEPEADPLPLYLNSLRQLAELDARTLVLPSHGRPFVGLTRRIAQLEEHHAHRIDATRAQCRARPTSAADLIPVLFKRQLDLHQTTFAIGEAIAHLHALWHAGELRRARGTDGVWRFSMPGDGA